MHAGVEVAVAVAVAVAFAVAACKHRFSSRAIRGNSISVNGTLPPLSVVDAKAAANPLRSCTPTHGLLALLAAAGGAPPTTQACM